MTSETTDQKTLIISYGNLSQDGIIEGAPFTVFSINGDSKDIQKMCKSARDACVKYDEEKERLSLFDVDGYPKSQKEMTEIGIEKQWNFITKWLDENFGYEDLVWKRGSIFPENIDRLEAMHFEWVKDHTACPKPHYFFHFHRSTQL